MCPGIAYISPLPDKVHKFLSRVPASGLSYRSRCCSRPGVRIQRVRIRAYAHETGKKFDIGQGRHDDQLLQLLTPVHQKGTAREVLSQSLASQSHARSLPGLQRETRYLPRKDHGVL